MSDLKVPFSPLTIEEVIALAEKSFNFKNVKIVNFHLEPFSKETLGYMSAHELLKIVARDVDVSNSEDKTMTFFVKKIVPDCSDFIQSIFNREPRFFRDIVPRLLENYEGVAWAPKCLLAKSDFLVLEDLRSQDFRIISGGFEDRHMKALIRTLAHFHACSLLFEEKLGKPLNKVFPDISQEMMFINDGNFSWKWLASGIEVAEAIACKLNLNPKYVRKAYELTLEAVKPKIGEKNVFGHSDLWCNNIMFDKHGDKCLLIDFQLVSYKSYVIDLIQILHLNIASKTRKESERNLIELYHKTLIESLKRNRYKSNFVTLEKVFQDVKTKRICGHVAAVQIFPIALLNEQMATKFVIDNETRMKHMYGNRKDFVLKALEEDEIYRKRVEESIRECVDCVKELYPML